MHSGYMTVDHGSSISRRDTTPVRSCYTTDPGAAARFPYPDPTLSIAIDP